MAIERRFTAKDVNVLSRKTVYKDFFTLDKLQLRHRLFDGGWSEAISRELFVRSPAVGVLLYDPENQWVGLIEQFRIGALENSTGPWLLEVVAGIVGAGEDPQDVARREVREEAGIRDVRLQPICDYLVSPGGTNERVSLYCGLADLTDCGGVFGLPHEHEDILLHVIPRQEAFAALDAGLCNNAATTICLQWLKINHPVASKL